MTLTKQLYGFTIHVREGEVDESLAASILSGKSGYEKRFRSAPPFRIEAGERWLDLGGHIGSFALFATLRGARALVSVEPAPTNFALLAENLRANGLETIPLEAAVTGNGAARRLLYLHTRKPGVYRTTNTANHSLLLRKPPERPPDTVEVACVNINELLEKYAPRSDEAIALKLDIEGAESEVLGAIVDWSPIRKVVLEYHFYGQQRQLSFYRATLALLAERFPNVRASRSYPEELSRMDFWPDCGMIWAW